MRLTQYRTREEITHPAHLQLVTGACDSSPFPRDTVQYVVDHRDSIHSHLLLSPAAFVGACCIIPHATHLPLSSLLVSGLARTTYPTRAAALVSLVQRRPNSEDTEGACGIVYLGL
jgi:hypothetical protein